MNSSVVSSFSFCLKNAIYGVFHRVVLRKADTEKYRKSSESMLCKSSSYVQEMAIAVVFNFFPIDTLLGLVSQHIPEAQG